MSLLSRLNYSSTESSKQEGTLATAAAGGENRCEHDWVMNWEPGTLADLDLLAAAKARLADHWMVSDTMSRYITQLLPGELPGPHHLTTGECFHVGAAYCRKCSKLQLLMRQGLTGASSQSQSVT